MAFDYQSIQRDVQERMARERRAKNEAKREKLTELSEACLANGYEEMGQRLASAAEDGLWVKPRALFAPPRRMSVYKWDFCYREVMEELAGFFNEKGHADYGEECARLAESPELYWRRSGESTEQDKEDLSPSSGQDSDQEAQGMGEVESEDGRAEEDGPDEPVDSEGTHTGEDEEAGASDQPRPPRAHPLALPMGRDVGSWPAGGFADDDSAAPFVLHVMRYRSNLVGPYLTLDNVRFVSNPEMGASDPRLYEQAIRLGEDEAGYNFWFPRPGLPGYKMGKVDCSATGLATIVQALWKVVLAYDDMESVPSLQKQIQPLLDADGAMDYVRPLENRQTFCVLVEPFKPEGIRSALEALQLAARRSTAEYVIFYVDPVDIRVRDGVLSALVDVHPIIGWGN